MAWYWILAIVVSALIVALLLFVLISWLIYTIKKNRKVKRFIAYFDFAPEKMPETMNYQLLKLIDPVLRNKALMLRDAYESEIRILNAMKAGNGDYQTTIEELRSMRNTMKHLEKDFYYAIDLCKGFGFEVKNSHKDYLN